VGSSRFEPDSVTNKYAAETSGGETELTDIGEITISRGEGNTWGAREVEFEILTPSSDGAPDEQLASYESASRDFHVLANGTPLSLQYDSQSASWYATATIPDGRSSAVIQFVPIDDADIEWDETIAVRLREPDSSDPVKMGRTKRTCVIVAARAAYSQMRRGNGVGSVGSRFVALGRAVS
jgi:hypothetical protein